MKIAFNKMHGLGNDFVIVQMKDVPEAIDRQQLAKIMSDRRLGVGCDQFILWGGEGDEIQMQIFNVDGSSAMACGNATRCLSRLLYHKHNKTKINIDVSGRKVSCQYHNDCSISVDMGAVSFQAGWMPDSSALWSIAQQYNLEPKELICVDVGNPHLVIFSPMSAADRKVAGKHLQQSEAFPDGVNVGFAEIDGDSIKLQVWERGAGFTHACGSAAIACFSAANRLNYIQDKADVKFELGSLSMTKDGDHIIMNGPAEHIFSGEFYYEK